MKVPSCPPHYMWLRCEHCGTCIDGSYGSGRFCNISCRQAWVSGCRVKKTTTCPCGKVFPRKSGRLYCNPECRKTYAKVTGWHHTDEARARMSASHTGKKTPHKEETKRKIRLTLLRHYRPDQPEQAYEVKVSVDFPSRHVRRGDFIRLKPRAIVTRALLKCGWISMPRESQDSVTRLP